MCPESQEQICLVAWRPHGTSTDPFPKHVFLSQSIESILGGGGWLVVETGFLSVALAVLKLAL